jgi:2-dehydro-3-deoxyphosphogluconate aldolase/(4S)-4-hydroxy-2-oxoglutarate aldolase
MLTRESIKSELSEAGLIAVVRAKSTEQAVPLSRALLAGGIRAIEITFSTPNAPEAIRNVISEFGDAALVGVGTVINEEQCHAALDAGAKFVVTPILRTSLIAPVHKADRAIMVGAYSPTEAQTAYEAGADMVKIFPADGLGPSYIKALRAPLPHLPIVPTGGVNLDTMESFLKAGCVALGVGSSLLTKSIMASDDWPALTQLARQFSDRLKQIRQSI